jgi:hypothetical protein
LERFNVLSLSLWFFCVCLLLSLLVSIPAWTGEQEGMYRCIEKCVENTKEFEGLNTEIFNRLDLIALPFEKENGEKNNQIRRVDLVPLGRRPDLKMMLAQNTEEDPQVYQEQDYGYPQDYEGNLDEPADDGFFRKIQDSIDIKPKGDQNFGEDAMPPEESRPITQDPYAGGAVQKLLGDKPELLITDIVMRNPNKRELIVYDELKPRDWVFEVRVQNVGKIPVNGVEILVAVGNKRLKTSIPGTIEYNKSARSFVHMRASQKLLSKRSVEVNAIVDPHNNVDEVNEDNNLFTKRFMLKR